MLIEHAQSGLELSLGDVNRPVRLNDELESGVDLLSQVTAPHLEDAGRS